MPSLEVEIYFFKARAIDLNLKGMSARIVFARTDGAKGMLFRYSESFPCFQLLRRQFKYFWRELAICFDVVNDIIDHQVLRVLRFRPDLKREVEVLAHLHGRLVKLKL
jgi:hypothetical protein